MTSSRRSLWGVLAVVPTWTSNHIKEKDPFCRVVWHSNITNRKNAAGEEGRGAIGSWVFNLVLWSCDLKEKVWLWTFIMGWWTWVDKGAAAVVAVVAMASGSVAVEVSDAKGLGVAGLRWWSFEEVVSATQGLSHRRRSSERWWLRWRYWPWPAVVFGGFSLEFCGGWDPH